MGHAIFISYRRDDTEGEAGRLFDDLSRSFGDDCVFMDVAGITPGTDFRTAIEDNVVSCGVLLAVIGPSWVNIKDAAGSPRLSDPNDFVRLEISSALKRKVAVIPVLVHEARMPTPESVPEELKDLCYRNSVELSHARWNSDVALLITALKSYVKSNAATEQHPVHATVAVQLPPPRPPEEAEPPVKKRAFSPLMQGVAAAVLIVAAAAAYFSTHRSDTSDNSMDQASGQSANHNAIEPAVPDADDGGVSTGNSRNASKVQPAPQESPRAAEGGPEESKAADFAADPSPGEAGLGDGEQPTAERLQGRWMVQNPNAGNGLAYLEIFGSGSQVMVHAWGACQPKACDWGTRPAMQQGKGVTATFGFPADFAQTGTIRVATVKVFPGLNGLDALVKNEFTENGGTRSTGGRLQLVPAR